MTIAFGRRATLRGAAAATAIAAAGGASAQSPFRLGIVAFQMSSETHARAANAAEAEARKRGWQVTLLNSRGSAAELPHGAHAQVRGHALQVERSDPGPAAGCGQRPGAVRGTVACPTKGWVMTSTRGPLMATHGSGVMTALLECGRALGKQVM